MFGAEPAIETWVEAVRDGGLRATAAEPRRHGRTWCVGVDALDNDALGRVCGGPPLGGAAFAQAAEMTQISMLHRAQISVTYPGYPRQDPGESCAAHRFRRDRDAAHLDGLLPIGPEKRRFLREPHAWILGIPLTQADALAAPLVVFEGSHRIIREAFAQGFDGIDPRAWAQIDVTDIYKAARMQVFADCARVEVPLAPGQTVLVHRMAIHGVAPWAQGAQAEDAGRAIAYFRPCFDSVGDWLRLDQTHTPCG